jgi:hypothetical protein
MVELKCWLTSVRVLNVLAVVIMLAFQVWYIFELLAQAHSILVDVMRLLLPAFIVYAPGELDSSRWPSWGLSSKWPRPSNSSASCSTPPAWP